MSALRLSRPGYPTLLVPVDDGAVGRVSHSRLGIKGGSVQGAFVVGVVKSNAQHQAAYKAREAEKARARRARCGRLLPYIGEPCARTAGHKYDCKSAEAMERMAAGRRSDVGRWP